MKHSNYYQEGEIWTINFSFFLANQDLSFQTKKKQNKKKTWQRKWQLCGVNYKYLLLHLQNLCTCLQLYQPEYQAEHKLAYKYATKSLEADDRTAVLLSDCRLFITHDFVKGQISGRHSSGEPTNPTSQKRRLLVDTQKSLQVKFTLLRCLWVGVHDPATLWL